MSPFKPCNFLPSAAFLSVTQSPKRASAFPRYALSGQSLFPESQRVPVGYFTVSPDLREGSVDWKWLLAQNVVKERGNVLHLRFADPLLALRNGRFRQGLIFKPNSTSDGSAAGDYFLDIGSCASPVSTSESTQ